MDNGKRLEGLRAMLSSSTPPGEITVQPAQQITPAETTLLSMLEAAEKIVAKPDVVQKFVGTFFDDLSQRLSIEEFSNFFDFELIEHSNFEEPTARGFIIRVLSNEARPDNFVTATITRTRKSNPWNNLYRAAALLADDEQISEIYDLQLNCSMQRVQLRITLTPKYTTLKRMVLVVTCAPSLEHCYIFETVTQHSLKDWDVFDSEGTEVTRRWYKLLWDKKTSGVVESITQKLKDTVKEHLEGTEKRLTKK